MRIGIDFDNTLAQYDHVFAGLAQESGLAGPDEKISKSVIRQLLRQKENGEILWQRLQGQIYGPRMQEARLFMGVDQFLSRCAAAHEIQVYIVSHKTRFGHFDESQVNLRDAATLWMRKQGFFDTYAIPENHIFFEATQSAKVARIASLQCDVFIDDLLEIFTAAGFPCATQRILYTDAKPCLPLDQVDHICANWQEIEAQIFGN
jgi:hypothetical protein